MTKQKIRVAEWLLCILILLGIWLGNRYTPWCVIPIYFIAGLIAHVLYPASPIIPDGVNATKKTALMITTCCGFISLLIIAIGEDFPTKSPGTR